MRILVTPLRAGELTVRGDEHHYLSHVRRARAGDAIEVFDGAGQRARAQIVRIGEAETVLRVDAVEVIADLPPRVRVLLPAIKGDRMDTCIEKLVEVGVDEIVVWPAARAVVKLDGARRASRIEHYQAIATAASRQCGRASVPAVSAVDSLAAALVDPGILVLLDVGADPATWPDADRITLISGPEGGFAPAEHDAITNAGAVSIGLGPRVLRAETAPVIAVALLRSATRS